MLIKHNHGISDLFDSKKLMPLLKKNVDDYLHPMSTCRRIRAIWCDPKSINDQTRLTVYDREGILEHQCILALSYRMELKYGEPVDVKPLYLGEKEDDYFTVTHLGIEEPIWRKFTVDYHPPQRKSIIS
jgi:hypothetical protein